MANTSTTRALLSLDHATNKAALKDFLRDKPLFADLDYEGSNINLLLDLLAYNNFLGSFYTNMVYAESFLDSAQLRSSVVSHAKDLNYLPQSVHSARAKVTVTFTASGVSKPYLIPRGSQFTTLVKSQAFTFTTNKPILINSSTSDFSFTTDIYEGVYHGDQYLFAPSEDIQRFQLKNKDVDVNSIVITVYEDGSEEGDTYKFADTLLGLTSSSKVFFVQAALDGYYEILFGDGVFGRKPKAQSLIDISYRVSKGEAANGSKVFSCDFDPTGVGETTTAPVVTTVEVAVEGSERETTESIRTLAPRYFAAQYRGVASDDYSALILSKFPSEVDDISVYGGETQEPKQYGRVIVAVKPVQGTIASNYLKESIKKIMRPYISIPTRLIIHDPVYFYLGVTSVVQYDKTATTKLPSELVDNIMSEMSTYAVDNLQKFGRDFRYSRFVTVVDETDTSIVSNETTVTLIKRLTPTINYPTSFEIDWRNTLRNSADTYCLKSSTFTFVSAIGAYYENAFLQDDGEGNIDVWAPVNGRDQIVGVDIGLIDYDAGTTSIKMLLTSDYTNHISLMVKPVSKDIIMDQKNVLMLDLADVTVEMTEKVS